MGYFKRRREKRDRAVVDFIMSYISKQGQVTETAMKQAIRKVRNEQLEYDVQLRKNLTMLMENDPVIWNSLVLEVAEIVNDSSGKFGYKIAKAKREALAEEILYKLSLKK